ncbi:MAG TPA: ABC transporter permease [Actinotalea sp.]|jgi:ABC-2 type transport system permease protein
MDLVITLLADLRRSPELLANLTRREVKGKYKRTLLGQLWSLANPIALMIIYTAVFSVIIRVRAEPGDPSGLDVFAVWLMCGLLAWSFFTNVVTSGMGALVANENLIKKVYFPRITLVAASSLAALFTWAIEMAVLAVVLLVIGADLWLWIPGVLAMMALLALFSMGVAMILSIANVHFRDTQHLMSIVFQAWFYLSPVLYPVSLVKEHSDSFGQVLGFTTLIDIYRLNPMERFIEVFRNLLYDNRMPELDSLLYCVGWTAVALVLGGWVFARNQKKLAEAL